MKKITYFILLFLAVSSCKYDDNQYSFTREFDGGTFITEDGIVKYISGNADSLILVTDVYAEVQENITYVKKNPDGILTDSILIWGHVYSLSPNPVVCGYDSVDKIDLLARLQQNSVFDFNGTGEPQAYATEDNLFAGHSFTNSFGLQWEKDYYVRSFVVTGTLDGGTPQYKDIAYNQRELKVRTTNPTDTWVGGGMQDTPSNFPNSSYWGATSFSYNGYMFVTQGHNAEFGSDIILYRYDPVTDMWDDPSPYQTLNIGEQFNFSNAVSFVIEDVEVNTQIFHDCLFLGLGITSDADEGNSEFFRLDLEANLDKPIGQWGQWDNITDGSTEQNFPSASVENAIAFSINGIAYIMLGTTDFSNNATPYIIKYDPAEKSFEHDKGTWENITDFPGGDRTEAVSFQIGDNVYISCGRDDGGVYKNDLWKCTQITGDRLNIIQKANFPGEPRVEAIAFALGEVGYVGLGKNSAGEALYDFWRYDPFTDSWAQMADFGMVDVDPNLNDDVHVWEQWGLPRYEAIGVGVKISENDYRGFVGTGWAGVAVDASDYNDVWEYRP